MEKLVELLKQIQELAGVGVDALQGAGGREGGPPHEGGGRPQQPSGGPPHEGGGPPPHGGAPEKPAEA